jgi:uncharacterized protein YwgA
MHIQKVVYVAQELGIVPPAYEFVLYQRGPYSFDLDAGIRELRSIGAVDIRPAPPYGPTYETTEMGEQIANASPVGGQASQRLNELAAKLGIKQAKDLELLATTLYVVDQGYTATDEIIGRVGDLKPQFERERIELAMVEIEELKSSFSQT